MSTKIIKHPTVLYDAVLTRIDESARVLIFNVAHTPHCVSSPHFGSWWHVGMVGRLSLACDTQPFGFFAYPDQRLRRAPERDDLRRQRWGWRIAQRRLTAKAGVIPGKDGALVTEDTEPVCLDLPREFLNFCANRNIQPEVVLRGFMADLCELMNWCSCPREDGYCSNGSDERMYAQAYFQRAYGWLEFADKP
jgi:hypothetical protein